MIRNYNVVNECGGILMNYNFIVFEIMNIEIFLDIVYVFFYISYVIKSDMIFENL